jgi:NAD(P)-dependent dehydrogenase (short-subunit alcohol dehydrogenase family)
MPATPCTQESARRPAAPPGGFQDAQDYADQHGVDLRTVELDISSQDSCDAGIARIIEESGRLDVVLHNAGHMVLGPLEAYTPDELTHVYDVNVLGTQRVNRAALPHLRGQGEGLLLWVGSTSTRGGTRPSWPPTSRPKPPWIRSRSVMPPSSSSSVSTPRS